MIYWSRFAFSLYGKTRAVHHESNVSETEIHTNVLKFHKFWPAESKWLTLQNGHESKLATMNLISNLYRKGSITTIWVSVGSESSRPSPTPQLHHRQGSHLKAQATEYYSQSHWSQFTWLAYLFWKLLSHHFIIRMISLSIVMLGAIYKTPMHKPEILPVCWWSR